MNWQFVAEALEEYEEAALYFDNISPRIGDQFVSEFESAIRQILQHPSANLRGRNKTRRRRLRHFPYLIVFRTDPELNSTIHIIAVAYERRGDDYWKRISDR